MLQIKWSPSSLSDSSSSLWFLQFDLFHMQLKDACFVDRWFSSCSVGCGPPLRASVHPLKYYACPCSVDFCGASSLFASAAFAKYLWHCMRMSFKLFQSFALIRCLPFSSVPLASAISFSSCMGFDLNSWYQAPWTSLSSLMRLGRIIFHSWYVPIPS